MGKRSLDRKLYDAVKSAKMFVVKDALSAGGNPNAGVGKKGMTAMDRARAMHPGNIELLALLVQHGGLLGDGMDGKRVLMFKVGMRVVLSPAWKDEGTALYGPMTVPSDVGEVLSVDPEEDESIQVRFKGQTWKYTPEAIMAAPESDDSAPRLMSTESGDSALSGSTRRKAGQLRNELAAQLGNMTMKSIEKAPVFEVKDNMSRLARASVKSKSKLKFKLDLAELEGALSKGPVKRAGGTAAGAPTPAAAAAVSPSPPATPVAVPKQADAASGVSEKQWEIPRADVTQGAKLGEGMFGQVYEGVAKGVSPGVPETKVAIKTLSDESEHATDDFLKEAEIMQELDGPYKIVRLLGICTKEKPYLMLMELMENGDLKTVLRKHRPKKSKPSTFSMQKLGTIALDVAEGMEYLASKKIVHRDLAARNCLVNDVFSARIGDFGLTRNVYQDEYYRMTGSAPMPVRWMAPEALMDGISITAGDVWAFGVVLWELVSFAKLPYGLLSNMEVCEQVTEEDYRMPSPKGCPEPIYDIMLSCWKEEPSARVDFPTLVKTLGDLIPKLLQTPVEYVKKSQQAPVSPVAEPTAYTTPGTTTPAQSPPGNAEYAQPVPMPGGEYMVPAEAADPDTDDDNDDNDDNDGAVAMYDSGRVSEPKVPPKLGSNAQTATGKDVDGGVKSLAALLTQKRDPVRRTSGAAVLASDRTEIASRNDEETVSELGHIVTAWIEAKTAATIGGSIADALRSGLLLCQLMEALSPGSIPHKPHTGRGVFKHRENIAWFLEAARRMGVKEADLFATNDLYEESNMKQVLICLNAVKKVSGT